METQERGGFQDDRGTDQPARAHEERTEPGDHAVGEAEIGRPFPGTIENQQLVLDEDGFGHHGTGAAGTGKSGDRRQQMQNKDSQVAHATILANPRNRRHGRQFGNSPCTVVMAHAETVILDALREALLDPDVLEAAIHRAAARLSTDQNTSDLAAAELRQLDAELARLTDAIAAGGDVPALVEAIRVREERRRTVHRQVQARARTASALDLRAITTDLRTRVQDGEPCWMSPCRKRELCCGYW